MNKILLVTLSAGLLTGCSLVGANPKAPSKLEQGLFTIVTNKVTVLETNVVPQYATNTVVVTVTNPVTQVVQQVQTLTNWVTAYQTNVVPVQKEQYNYQGPSQATKDAISTGTGLLNTFFPGAGPLAGYAILALLGGYGYARSTKQGTVTTSALAQEMETVLEFVKALPNGQVYADQLTTFLQQHQTETGVVTQVVEALNKNVSNSDAKVAAQEVINAINALKSVTSPIPPVVTG